jgi:hypothetical protein
MAPAFLAARVDGLHDKPRSGTPRTITDDRIEAVVVKTLESAPAGATHWSSRKRAMRSIDRGGVRMRCYPR